MTTAVRFRRAGAGVALASGAALAVVVLGAQAPSTPPAAPSAGQRPVFRSGANVVVVDAYPRRDGKIVEGLTAGDVEVFEDGRAQRIETFELVRATLNVPETARRDPDGLNEMYAEAANPLNRVFVAFLDTLHVGVDAGVVGRRPLMAALDRIVGRDDLFGVMTPNLRATDLTLGRRAQSVDQQLSRYWTWGQAQRISTDPNDSIEGDLVECFHRKVIARNGAIETIDWLVTEGPVRRFLDEILIERRREDRTFTSLENLVRHLGSMRETRSVVLALSNGWTLVPRREELAGEPFKDPPDVRFLENQRLLGRPRPGGDELVRAPAPPNGLRAASTDSSRLIQGCLLELERLSKLEHDRRLRDLTALATRNNVSVFPIAVGGLAATDAGAAERVITTGTVDNGTFLSRDLSRMTGRVQALRTVAEGTGGTAIVNTNDLDRGLAGIVDELSSYYLISYSPANAARDGRYRRIEVRSKVPGVSMRARAGYVATEALAAASPVGGPAPPNPATLEVERALGALGRARAASEVTSTALVDGQTIITVVELGAGFLTAGWREGGAVRVEAVGANGVRAGEGSSAIAAGTRSTTVQIPVGASTGPWRVTARITGARSLQDGIDVDARPAMFLGEPIVYRATPSPRSPLSPVADLLFSRTERVRVVWPIVDRPDTAAARLLDRQGRALAGALAAVPATVDGRPILAVDFALGALSDGDYVVEVRATRGTSVERKLQAFRVVR